MPRALKSILAALSFRPMRKWSACALQLILVLAASSARAAGPGCPLTGEKPMLSARLFFGQSIAGPASVPAQAWNSFLAQTVTPLFPSGFTVYDASGQWQDAAHAVTRENTKVIEIETDDTPAARAKLEDMAAAYKKQFHQESVGIVTTTACARF